MHDVAVLMEDGMLDGVVVSASEAYAVWAEPLRVADDDTEHARFRQNRRGVLPPESWWSGVPCGHPRSPVAWLMPDGALVCHCAELLGIIDVGGNLVLNEDPLPLVEHPDGEIVPCTRCGCVVLVLEP